MIDTVLERVRRWTGAERRERQVWSQRKRDEVRLVLGLPDDQSLAEKVADLERQNRALRKWSETLEAQLMEARRGEGSR